MNDNCPIFVFKDNTVKRIVDLAIKKLRNNPQKPNLIWLEATGCSGNIISLLNATNPDIIFFLKNMVNMTYNNSLMSQEGENAFEKFLNTLETEFILVVEGAVSTKNNGLYTIIARYHSRNRKTYRVC